MPLYFWGQQSKAEVDFVLEKGLGVAPLEVRSSAKSSKTSARYFARKHDCSTIYLANQGDFGSTPATENGLATVSLPLYAIELLAEELR